MTIKSGYALRRLIAVKQLLDNVVHFGVNQVFGQARRNTSILVLDQLGEITFFLSRSQIWQNGATASRESSPLFQLLNLLMLLGSLPMRRLVPYLTRSLYFLRAFRSTRRDMRWCPD